MRSLPKVLLATGLALTAAGCGSTDDGSSTLSNMFFFNKAEAPEVAKPPTEAIYCPQVDVYEGGAHISVGRGGQATISDLARECHVSEDGSVLIKVGVAGRVILSAGSGGRYSVPVNIRIKGGDKVVAQRSQSAGVSIAAGQTSGEFAVVQEGLVAPAAFNQNFDIEVGLGRGRAAARPNSADSWSE